MPSGALTYVEAPDLGLEPVAHHLIDPPTAYESASECPWHRPRSYGARTGRTNNVDERRLDASDPNPPKPRDAPSPQGQAHPIEVPDAPNTRYQCACS